MSPTGSPSGVNSTTRSLSVRQRNCSPSGERKFLLPLALMRSTAVCDAASGSAMASSMPRMAARTKSWAAVGWSSMNPAFV